MDRERTGETEHESDLCALGDVLGVYVWLVEQKMGVSRASTNLAIVCTINFFATKTTAPLLLAKTSKPTKKRMGEGGGGKP